LLNGKTSNYNFPKKGTQSGASVTIVFRKIVDKGYFLQWKYTYKWSKGARIEGVFLVDHPTQKWIGTREL
jgi:hypothetical protein